MTLSFSVNPFDFCVIHYHFRSSLVNDLGVLHCFVTCALLSQVLLP